LTMGVRVGKHLQKLRKWAKDPDCVLPQSNLENRSV
jgi:hypothetical protein